MASEFNAEDARRLHSEHHLGGLDILLGWIRDEAIEGKSETIYYTESVTNPDAILVELQRRGFRVYMTNTQFTIKW